MLKPRQRAPIDETLLQRRIRERLELLRRSPRDVSLKAGLGPDAIRTILSGRSRSPRGETLQALAEELQCEVGYLLGEVDKPWSSDDLHRDSLGRAIGIARLKVAFRLSLNWVTSPLVDDLDDENSGDLGPPSDIFSLPEYLPGYQQLEIIEDDHAILALRRGSFVHSLTKIGGDLPLRDRDLVILQRQRLSADGSSPVLQRTLRVARIRDGGSVLLETPTNIPDLQDEVTLDLGRAERAEGTYIAEIDPKNALQSHEALTIEGIALRGITAFAGPSIARPPSREEKITHSD